MDEEELLAAIRRPLLLRHRAEELEHEIETEICAALERIRASGPAGETGAATCPESFRGSSLGCADLVSGGCCV
jgi:hypothetical protein